MAEADGIERHADGTWAKGTSGNPSGRPKGQVSLVMLMRRRLRESMEDETQKDIAEDIVASTLKDAVGGDRYARELVWAYIDGKPGVKSDEDDTDNAVVIIDDA